MLHLPYAYIQWPYLIMKGVLGNSLTGKKHPSKVPTCGHCLKQQKLLKNLVRNHIKHLLKTKVLDFQFNQDKAFPSSIKVLHLHHLIICVLILYLLLHSPYLLPSHLPPSPYGPPYPGPFQPYATPYPLSEIPSPYGSPQPPSPYTTPYPVPKTPSPYGFPYPGPFKPPSPYTYPPPQTPSPYAPPTFPYYHSATSTTSVDIHHNKSPFVIVIGHGNISKCTCCNAVTAKLLLSNMLKNHSIQKREKHVSVVKDRITITLVKAV